MWTGRAGTVARYGGAVAGRSFRRAAHGPPDRERGPGSHRPTAPERPEVPAECWIIRLLVKGGTMSAPNRKAVHRRTGPRAAAR